mgnify:CR=1 FL=1
MFPAKSSNSKSKYLEKYSVLSYNKVINYYDEIGNEMLVVGLTGSSGSGKGYVCEIMEREGIPSLDTDGVCHEVYRRGEDCRAELEKKEIRLSGEDEFFFCDAEWLTEAFGNLIKNALDHTSAGGIISVDWKKNGNILGTALLSKGISHLLKKVGVKAGSCCTGCREAHGRKCGSVLVHLS